MIRLWTGTPGAGKTQHLLKTLKELFLKEDPPRIIFSNVNLLDLQCLGFPEGVDYFPLPSTSDSEYTWHDLYHEDFTDSIFIIDECQKVFPSKKSGRKTQNSPDYVIALSEHRHFGHDFLITTQHSTLIDEYLCSLVNEHYHLNAIAGGATVFYRNKLIDLTKDLSKCEKTIWLYDKSIFNCYKSTRNNTKKNKIPQSLITYVTLVSIGLILVFYFLSKSIFIPMMNDKPIVNLSSHVENATDVIDTKNLSSQTNQSNQSNQNQSRSQELIDLKKQIEQQNSLNDSPKIKSTFQTSIVFNNISCISSSYNCYCFEDGQLIDLTYSQCIKQSDNPYKKLQF